MEMGIIAWIIIGIVAGWLAEQIMGRNHGLVVNLVVGIAGAVIGGWLAGLTGFPVIVNAFVTSIIIATIGAVILLYLLGLMKRR
ncbi:MAG: GlsB/YeaQ/YmgE family stress response membrane protein [Caulobacterales bacterium]|nr:GlsB/YeaQ/YmgE family stress response membrane protein [Caulobacterales bacterium]